MESFGGKVTASPSMDTESGRAILAQDPMSPGSLGIAISEAVELAMKDPQTKYSLGSVLNHVLIHQSVIGEEALRQMEEEGEYPDVVVGCVGGGSNFGGVAFPFLGEKLRNGGDTRSSRWNRRPVPKSPRGSTPTITGYGYADPMMKMHTLGHTFVPPAIHAGGLRYHGMATVGFYGEGVGAGRGPGIPHIPLLRCGAPVCAR